MVGPSEKGFWTLGVSVDKLVTGATSAACVAKKGVAAELVISLGQCPLRGAKTMGVIASESLARRAQTLCSLVLVVFVNDNQKMFGKP